MAVVVCAACGQENPEGARFCNACGSPLDTVPRLRETRRTVTVLFCDVAGYTERGDRLDPEALRRLQARYFDESRAALERHGATVEKFIGDAVMAVFGIPQLHEDDALRAVRAAVELRAAVERLELQGRIGINTGEVVAGGGDALVTGDAVNVAARLEQAARPGEILIGEATYRLARDAVDAEPVSVAAKGKGEPVAARRLLLLRPGAAPYERRLDSPMVGRERERALLRQAFDRAVEERACHLFTVLGVAGVGKSRLVAELLREVENEATVLRGRCLSYGEGITFWPLVEIVKGLGADSAAGIAALVSGDDGELIGAHLAGALALEDTPTSLDETGWAFRKLLEALARERPLVAVLDDVHWGEPALLDLVDNVADWSRDAPILLVCLARPELLDERPGWGGGKLNATSVLLEPLSQSGCRELIANLLGQAEVADDVRGRIAEAAEGNPLFVEEMLATLIDDGLLESRDGEWTATGDLSQIAVPASIQALLAARLDRLGAEERIVIERGAVEGKLFHRGAVAELSPDPLRPAVSAHLMALVRKELVRPERGDVPGEDAFRFRHLLLRDAAYEALPKEARAELHQRFAAWLGGRTGVEFEEIVAYHLEQAVRYRAELGSPDYALARRAAELLVSSGRRAFAGGDMEASRSLLTRAAELLPRDDPVRLSLLPDLGAALRDTGDFSQARAVLAEAGELARAARDEGVEARARVALLAARLQFEPQLDLEELAREAADLPSLFARLGDERGQAEALLLLATVSWTGARAAATVELLDRAREHARRSGDRRLDLEAVRWLAIGSFFGPTPVEEGLDLLDRLADGVEHWAATAAALTGNLRAGFEAMLGRFDDARRSLEHCIELNEELGHRVTAAAMRGHLGGFIERLAGDATAAERSLRQSLDDLGRFGEKSYLSSTAASLADVLVDEGRLEEAGALVRLAEDAASPDDRSAQMTLWAARAKVLARQGDFPAAESAARRAVEIAEETDFLDHQGDVYLALCDVLSLSGRAGDAVPAAQEALDRYERKGNRVSAERARARLAAAR